MMRPSYFISDEAVFGKLRKDLELAVRLDFRLPKVFIKQSFQVLGFEEFDWAMSDEFWPVLQSLVSQSGEQELVCAVLDPDPVSYFRTKFGYYNWAKLPVSLSSEDYWKVVNTHPIESPADSILAKARTVVFTVPSKKWWIWAERESGLCVFASADGDIEPAWNTLDWVIDLHPTEEWKVFAIELAQRFGLLENSDCRRNESCT